MKNRKILALAMGCSFLFLNACKHDELNLKPTNDITSDVAYSTPAGYRSGIAKVYGSFATTGNQGSGSGDLGGIDAGTSDFLRLYWMAQELPTDEALCSWTDDGIPGLNFMSWTSTNVMLLGAYARSVYQVTLVNEFLRESTDAKLSARNITGADATEIGYFRAEARFLRAFQYWVLMDLFGNPPFVTEENAIGKEAPKQIQRAELFKYIESELLAIESELKTTNEYGRATQAAAQALLARLYLNAKVYTGQTYFDQAASYAEKVIQGPYSLHSNYANLFKADNHINNPEAIFTINYDGVRTQNFGGMTYLINAAIGGDMNAADYGIPNGGWGGNRSRSPLPLLFGDYLNSADKRAIFYGTTPNIENPNTYKEGVAVVKFTNKKSNGDTAESIGGSYASTDFPLFRLAEQYLIYAEAVLRGGSGSTATALTYINTLRERAYGNSNSNLTALTLEDVFKERSKELYWEGFRRTDLIRFERFVEGAYVWPWKGNSASGRGVESFRTLYPIPAADIIANQNLVQNAGY